MCSWISQVFTKWLTKLWLLDFEYENFFIVWMLNDWTGLFDQITTSSWCYRVSTLIIGIIMILINMSIILNFISLSTYKRKKILTGTLSGYFFLIFSPSALLFSKECSSLYSHFIFAEDPDKLNSDVNGTFLSVNKMADHWYKQSNHCTKQNSSVNYHK